MVAEFTACAANPPIDGVSYADVDECASYATSIFANGCLIGTAGQILPAYTALQQLAAAMFPR